MLFSSEAGAVCTVLTVRCLFLVQKILRRVVNLPSGLLFPAAAKLLGAGNARSLAAHAIRPYLKKVTVTVKNLPRVWMD